MMMMMSVRRKLSRTSAHCCLSWEQLRNSRVVFTKLSFVRCGESNLLWRVQIQLLMGKEIYLPVFCRFPKWNNNVHTYFNAMFYHRKGKIKPKWSYQFALKQLHFEASNSTENVVPIYIGSNIWNNPIIDSSLFIDIAN